MFSPNFDNSTTPSKSLKLNAFVLITIVLGWVALLVGMLSVLWKNSDTMPGALWADQASTGAAICLAVIYVAAIVNCLWFVLRLLITRQILFPIQVLLLGVMPLIITFWGLVESNSHPSIYSRPTSSQYLNKLIHLNSLAHHRLFAGSLWQPSEQVNQVHLFGAKGDESLKARLPEFDQFVSDVRAVLGVQATSTIKAHVQPLALDIAEDTANWINISEIRMVHKTGVDTHWRKLARSAIMSEITSADVPPTIVVAGCEEYFCRDTDELMGDYFAEKSDSLFTPLLNDLTSNENYSEYSRTHALTGGAFIAYLVEQLQQDNLIDFCKVKNSTDFQTRITERLGKPWTQVCNEFELWLSKEADRLGWDASRLVRNSELDR